MILHAPGLPSLQGTIQQLSLFESNNPAPTAQIGARSKLMGVMDSINRMEGKGTLRLARQHWQRLGHEAGALDVCLHHPVETLGDRAGVKGAAS